MTYHTPRSCLTLLIKHYYVILTSYVRRFGTLSQGLHPKQVKPTDISSVFNSLIHWYQRHTLRSLDVSSTPKTSLTGVKCVQYVRVPNTYTFTPHIVRVHVFSVVPDLFELSVRMFPFTKFCINYNLKFSTIL